MLENFLIIGKEKMRLLKNIILYCTIAAMLSSCEKSSIITYRIENITERDVKLLMYSTNTSKTIPNNIKMVSGKGLLVESSVEAFRGDTGNTPGVVLQADSIVVIFDNDRYESHYDVNIPFPNSILEFGSYERKTGKNVYFISQENFDNATPCDGPCN